MRRMPAWGVLGLLVAASTILRSWAGLGIPTPWIAADEIIYAELGRSLWETGRLEILGQPTAFYSLVHPALIGFPLALLDTAWGYAVARVLQALVMSLAAVPVFLWSRRLMSERWALVAATLTLSIPGLAYTGLLMTETVFYPVVTLAAWAAARALVDPTPRNQALLVLAAVLTVLTRLQGVVLVPVFFLAVALFAASVRSAAPVTRLWPSLAALGALGAFVLAIGLGAYEPVGTVDYDVADVLRYAAYHAADVVLFVGVVPVCAFAMLILLRDPSPDVRAYVAVTAALVVGFVLEVGVFASRYVGRLAERDLLPLAPVLFLGLALWLDRGAPRTRMASSIVAFGTAALVLVLPLGRLVHRGALPDAFSLVPVWEIGHYDAVVWGFVGTAVVAFALVPRGARALLPLALVTVFAASSVSVSRHIVEESELLARSFFGAARYGWVDDASPGEASYLYDGDVYWNAVWEYVFWNRDVRRVYVLRSAPPIPGPLPQTRVDPAPAGLLDDDSPASVLAATQFTFSGSPVATVAQSGLDQRGLVLWEVDPPLRLRSVIAGLQPSSGDIYGPSSMTAYDCIGGTFELTLVAKGSPVHVRLQSGPAVVEHTLTAGEIWRPSVPAEDTAGVCKLILTPSGLVGSTRFDFVPG